MHQISQRVLKLPVIWSTVSEGPAMPRTVTVPGKTCVLPASLTCWTECNLEASRYAVSLLPDKNMICEATRLGQLKSSFGQEEKILII